MKNSVSAIKPALLCLAMVFSHDPISAAQRGGSICPTSTKRTAIQNWSLFDGNTISCAINSYGPFCDYLYRNAAGLEWPKGSGCTALFTAGIWITGVHRPTGKLRTAVQNYETEYEAGPILGTFNTESNNRNVAADPNDPRYRVYKVNKGDANLPASSRNPDFDNWPGDLGAPFVDVNGNGKWDAGVDKVRLYGDQQLWCVYNDADSLDHVKVGVTPPLGIEVQATYFGFDQPGALGNTMFIRWIIINKSDADYDSVFISLWSDFDLGNAEDDLIGCDTLRALTFVYNGDDDDEGEHGYGPRPPAAGFALFQGPAVPGSSVDSALSHGVWRKGWKNLGVVSHAVFLDTYDPLYRDPPLGDPSYAGCAHEFQEGTDGWTHLPLADPTTGRPCPYVFPGDPVNGEGWTMTKSGMSPQDVRGMISTGPFTLAKGDTQEIVGAFVIGRGADRLGSVTVLRQFCDEARRTYEADFRVPVTTVATSVSDDSARMEIATDGEFMGASTVQATVKDAAGAQIISLPLYDDGAHGDQAPGDRVFGNSCRFQSRQKPVQLDLVVVDTSGQTSFWPQVVPAITTSELHATTPRVFWDDINFDGQVNRGETIRYGFTLTNPNPFSFSNVTVSRQSVNSFQGLTLPLVGPGATTLHYDPSDNNSYLSFSVPATFAPDEYSIGLTVTDGDGNLWTDTLVFPILPYRQRSVALQHLRGSAYGAPVLVLADTTAARNHLYLLTGVDSVDIIGNSGLTVKDSTDGRLLLLNSPLPDSTEPANSVPIEGFRIFPGTLRSQLYAHDVTSDPDTLRWFTGANGGVGDMLYKGAYLGARWQTVTGPSCLRKGDYKTVELRFSPKKSYTDANANGRYDVGEPYVVDSLNKHAAQKAFFYSKPTFGAAKFSGFTWVPFAAYDDDANPPRQLTVVVLDVEKNNQWDIDPLNGTPFRNYVWILSDSYDPSGKLYDPTQGGADIGALSLTKSVPYYYALWLMERTPATEAYSTSFSVTLVPSYPISAEDAYLFNPTAYTGIANRPLNVPTTIALNQNYPNPFNPSTTIGYQLPVNSFVTLKVYDILGREVATLVNRFEKAGFYEVRFDGTRLSSGVYFYTLRSGNHVVSKKLMVLK